MHLSAIDTISPATPIDQLPIRLEMAGSRGSLAVAVLLTLPVAAFLITPFALLGSHAAFAPDLLLKAKLSWPAAIQLTIAFIAAISLTVLAMRRVKMAWGRSATVEIGYGVVAVVERRFGVTRRWTGAISDFLGVAHNVRSSLSGARHELIMVHPDPSRSVLLRLDKSIAQPHIDRVAILLGLSEIPARSAMPAPMLAPASAIVQPGGAEQVGRPKLRLAA